LFRPHFRIRKGGLGEQQGYMENGQRVKLTFRVGLHDAYPKFQEKVSNQFYLQDENSESQTASKKESFMPIWLMSGRASSTVQLLVPEAELMMDEVEG